MIRILTICTGNVCRSPLAAQLLRARLDPTIFRVDSAGTSPLIGDRMPDETQRIATRMGINDAREHRARALTEETLSESDLILGMARKHRRSAVQLHPPAVRHSFSLLEFAHVVSSISDQHVSTLIHQDSNFEVAVLNTVMRMRGVVPRLYPEHLYDAEDPFGRSNHAFERSAQQIEYAVEQIANFFDRIFTERPLSQEQRYQPS